MGDKIRKLIAFHLLLGAFFCLFPALSGAGLTVKTEIVSGNIIRQDADHSVWLDNGMVYSPSRKGLVIDSGITPVTLRYYTDVENKNIFFEFAPGLGSLQELAPTPTTKDNKPK